MFREVQEEWIDLFSEMKKRPGIDTDFLAAPFLSLEPRGYDPSCYRTILYVGKATGGDWYSKDFQENPYSDARRACTMKFLEEKVATRLYNSSFWRFASKLNELTSGKFDYQLQNLVWSNIAKIGIKRGNPCSRYLAPQEQLASKTLAEEIRFYQPSLVVFVTGDYGEKILIDTFRSFSVDWDDEAWQQLDDRVWARAAATQMPSILCLPHPQGKTREQIRAWLQHASLLLDK